MLSAWVQLAALLSFAALAAPFFLGRVYIADDLGEFHLPLRNFYADQLGRAEPFDWMPSLYGGFYVTGEGQLGAYHPLHYVLYRWLPLGAAFDLELLASYPLMFAGMYFFLKRLIQRRDAASFGALAFTFCGFNLLHFVHPNAIAIVAHIPWLLLAIDVALSADQRQRRAVAELGIGLLTASQLLLGYPQYVWFSLLIETAFAAWLAIGLRAGFRSIAPLLLAETLGVLIGAVQWLPTWHALSDSVRQVPDAAFANTGSLHPLNLVQLVAPYLFQTRVVGQNTHELGLYAGAAPWLLCVWLFSQRRNWGSFRPLVRALIVFGALALLLATGQFGGLYRLQSLLPLANRFRFPCRAIVLVQFCIASGAAVALALLAGRGRSRGLNSRAPSTGETEHANRPLAIVFLGSVALAVAGPLVWPQYVANGMLVWCGPALVGIAAGLIALAERGVRGALVALVAFTALDLSCYGLSYSVVPRTADLHQFVAGISRPPGNAPGRVAAPRSAAGFTTGDRMLLAGINRVDGYAGLEPTKRLNYNTRPAWQLAGVAWVLQPAERADEIESHWAAVAPTAPRARLVTRTALAQRPGETDPLPLETATVDDEVILPPANPGGARVIADSPGRITVDTSAPTRQLLVTTESFNSGWRAAVDDGAQRVVRVNGDFLGCIVEAGDHRVGFEFRPPGLQAGAVVCACGLELMLFTLWFRLRGSRRPNCQGLICHDPH
jgi:hypothetical protein